MKRLIVSEAGSGLIIATGPHPEEGSEAITKFGFTALAGQQVHAVELPEHVTTTAHLQELHDTHVLSVDGSTATLVLKAT